MKYTGRGILVVDDEEVVRIAFKKVLQKSDVTVDTAHARDKAASLLHKRSYKAVITDLRFSGSEDLEGVDVIQAARDTQSSECVIFVITAYGDSEIRSTVLARGADYYMEKPVSPKKIKMILESKGIYTE